MPFAPKVNQTTNTYTTQITSDFKWYHLNLKELWKYRDLLKMLVRRDVIIVYKQTILGPLWFVLQPLLTAVIFTVVFGNIAKLDTDNLPQFAFYLSGLVLWNFFADSFIKTSDTFFTNQNIFGKVYFPRLIVPIGTICSAFIKFLVQFILFIAICCYHYFITHKIHASIHILLFPVILVMMGLLGMGMGLIFTSLTTKYRDLKFLLQFGVQLVMWLTPIAYPLSMVTDTKLKLLLNLNPITHIIETLRIGFLGAGSFNLYWLAYSLVFAIITFVIGVFVFNKTEKDFIDRI